MQRNSNQRHILLDVYMCRPEEFACPVSLEINNLWPAAASDIYLTNNTLRICLSHRKVSPADDNAEGIS